MVRVIERKKCDLKGKALDRREWLRFEGNLMRLELRFLNYNRKNKNKITGDKTRNNFRMKNSGKHE